VQSEDTKNLVLKKRSCLMANMAQRSASKLFDLDPIDQPDKYDEVLSTLRDLLPEN
jgi:hypothetical protein